MSRIVIFAASLLGFYSTYLLADPPVSQEQLAAVPWKITPFLTGNTKQIRDAVNGSLEQLLQRKADKQQRIADANADLQKERDQAGATLRTTTPAFAKMQDGLVVLRTRQAAAKKNGDGATEIKTQNDADALEDKINLREDGAMKNDPAVVATKKEIADREKELKDIETAISSATHARDQFMDAFRRSKKIPGPPAVGASGILAQVKPTKIIDAHSFMTEYQAFEILGENKNAKTPDGLHSLSVKIYNTHLLVSGVDTTILHVGKETLMDHNFIITGTQSAGEETVYLVSPNADDKNAQASDYLFDALDDVHGLPSPAYHAGA